MRTHFIEPGCPRENGRCESSPRCAMSCWLLRTRPHRTLVLDEQHRFHAVAHLQLLHDVRHAVLDRLLAECQVPRDFLVGEATRNLRKNLHFPLGQSGVGSPLDGRRPDPWLAPKATAVGLPASCSSTMPTICFPLNRERLIFRLLSRLVLLEERRGSGHCRGSVHSCRCPGRLPEALKASNSQVFLADRWDVSESTVSRWVSQWQSEGLAERAGLSIHEQVQLRGKVGDPE